MPLVGFGFICMLALAIPCAQAVGLEIDGTAQKAEQGRSIAAELMCIRCHTVNFTARNNVPSVAGRPYVYIVKQLEQFRAPQSETRASTRHASLRGATDEQIDALGRYITSLGRLEDRTAAPGSPATGGDD